MGTESAEMGIHFIIINIWVCMVLMIPRSCSTSPFQSFWIHIPVLFCSACLHYGMKWDTKGFLHPKWIICSVTAVFNGAWKRLRGYLMFQHLANGY